MLGQDGAYVQVRRHSHHASAAAVLHGVPVWAGEHVGHLLAQYIQCHAVVATVECNRDGQRYMRVTPCVNAVLVDGTVDDCFIRVGLAILAYVDAVVLDDVLFVVRVRALL